MSPSGPTRNATLRSGTDGGVPKEAASGPGSRNTERRGPDAERRRFQRRHPAPGRRDTGEGHRTPTLPASGEGVGGTPTEGGENAEGEAPKRPGAERRTPALPAPGEGVARRGTEGGESGRWKRLLKSPSEAREERRDGTA